MIKCYSKSQIIQLLANYLSLFQSQWGEDGDFYCEDLQQQIFQYEKEILVAFGFPLNSECYLFLFDKATLCFHHHHALQSLYKQLTAKADCYFQEDRIMSKNNLDDDPFIALPELGVPVNSYTVFLYSQMLHNKSIQEAVKNEFNILKKTNRITEIYLLCFDVNYHKAPLFHTLIEDGLYLLPAYLRWYHR